MNTKICIGDLSLKNPVLVASGTFGYAQEFLDFVKLSKLGGIITKTVTLKPRSGNEPPRISETASGILNSIGLQNEGINSFLENKMPFLRKIGTSIVVSIGGDNIEEYAQLTRILDKTKGVDALELNISCPNVPGKQYVIAQDSDSTYQLVQRVRKCTDKTIITKLSPNVTDICSIAKAAEEGGSDAVSLVNTFLGMSINLCTKSPVLGNITGGLSGPAIKPIALRMVWQVANCLKVPVIGMGGIMNTEDALEFIIAGATAICVGTASFINPDASVKIIKGIEEYLKKNKISDINKLRGSLKNANA